MSGERLDAGELEAWRAAYRSRLPAAAEGCPGEEALAALVTGEVDGEARRRIADHLVGCRRCAADTRDLLALHREASRPEAPSARRLGVPWPWLLAGAAAAALLVGVGLSRLELARPAGQAGLRGTAAAERALEPPHGARLARPPERFAWSPPASGVYRVVVYDAESIPLWESEPTAERELALPPALRQRLSAAGTYYWRVRSEGGPAVRSTPLARFEIVP